MHVAARTSVRWILAVSLLLGLLVVAPVARSVAAPTPPPPSGNSSTAESKSANAKKATFGIGPANAKGIDRRPYLTFLTTPGVKLVDRVALVNVAKRPVRLNLYVVDTTLGSDGSLGFLPRASRRTDAATWIAPQLPHGVTTVTLGPQQTKVVPLAITIPANASPGDHAAGVIASIISKVITDKSPQGVDFEQRVALRAFFRVSGDLKPQLSIQGLTVKWKGTTNPVGTGKAVVDYTVRNTGNVRLGAKQKVSIDGLFGATTPKKPVTDIPLLFPGNAVHVSVEIPGVFPLFRMTAKVKLFPLTVAGDVDPGLPATITASKSFWAIPWTLLALIALVLLLGIGAWLRRRHVRRNRPYPPPGKGRHRNGPSPNGGPTRGGKAARTTAGVVSMVAALVAITAPAAQARDTTVPYTDYAVTGSVGLCDKNGHAVTSGSVNARPFIYRAVSSVAAVKPYDIAGRKATLLAYQPRRNANPNVWSGDTLTSSSTYTNPRYPMAQATSVDFTLADFIKEFPPQWDGLIQLRMYLGAPQQGSYSDTYPATDIKVTGDRWQVVRGATVPCTNGSAKDGETHYIPAVTKPSANASGHTSAKPSGNTSGSETARPGDEAAAVASDVAGSQKSSSKRTSAGAVIAVIAAALAVAALGVIFVRRYRGRTG